MFAVIFCAAYLAVFFSVKLDAGNFPAPTRWSIWPLVLLPDVVIGGWLGDGREFALLDRAPILLGAALFHAGAWAVGWLLLRVIRWSRGSRLEWGLVAHGLGMSVVSLATLCIGLAGGLQERWFLLAPWLAAVIAVAARCFITWRAADRAVALHPVAVPNDSAALPGRRRSTSTTLPIGHVDPNDWLSFHWLWLTVPFAVFVMLGGALPPIEFDVREYHLQAPKEFYQLGRITFLAHNVYANMPLGAEMWPLAAMSITGDWWLGALVGKSVIATLLPFTAAALYALGLRLGSRTAGIVAAIVYVSFPWMLQVSMFGLIEGAVAFYVALALLVLLGDDSTQHSTSAVALAGFFAGSAAACKYPALLFVVVPAVALLGWRARGQGAATVARQLSIALLSASIACAPWLIKNWRFTGNPTYPLFYSLFDGATRTAENAAQWREAHRPHGFDLPVLAGDVQRILLGSPGLSPVVWPLIACGLLSLVCGKRNDSLRGAAKYLALYAGFVFVCWWLFTHRIDRFWLPAAPALALLAGWGAANAADRLMQRGVLATLVIGWLWCLLWVASPLAGDCRYFAPLSQLRESPDRIDPQIVRLNRLGGRVFSIGEAAVFDFTHPVLYNTTFDPSWLERYGVNDPRSPESLAAWDKLIADHGIEYVYVDWDEIQRYRSPGNYGFDPRMTRDFIAQLIQANRLAPPEVRKEGTDGAIVYPVSRDGAEQENQSQVTGARP